MKNLLWLLLVGLALCVLKAHAQQGEYESTIYPFPADTYIIVHVHVLVARNLFIVQLCISHNIYPISDINVLLFHGYDLCIKASSKVAFMLLLYVFCV